MCKKALPPLLNTKELHSAICKDFRRGANSSSAAVERIIPPQNTPTCITLLRHLPVLTQITKLLPYLSKFHTHFLMRSHHDYMFDFVKFFIYLFIYLFVHYLLTPWSRVLLEKLTSKLCTSQEIPRIYGTRKFLNVPTSARQPPLS